MKENVKQALLDFFKKLTHLIIAILAFILSCLVAFIDYLKNVDWKRLFASFKTGSGRFNKERIVTFLKTHKKQALIAVIVFGILLILCENLFFTPSYDSGYSSSGGYSYRQSPYCDVCGGNKKCVTCKGRGTTSNYGFTVECKACDGSKLCWKCGGSGLK